MIRRAFALLVLASLAAAQIESSATTDAALLPEARVGPGPSHSALVAKDSPVAAAIRASGFVFAEYDYGAFTLFRLDERLAPSREAFFAPGWPIDDAHDLVALNGRLLDGARPFDLLRSLAPAERFDEQFRFDPSAGLYLVQFVGPVREEWFAALDLVGATFRQYLPHGAYVVAVDPARAALLPALPEVLPFVRFVAVYEPGFRLAPTLRDAALRGAAGVEPVIVQIVAGAGANAAFDQVSAFATRVVQSWRVGPYLNVEADLPIASLLGLARRPEIFSIEPRGVRRRNDEAQGQIVAGNVNATGPTAPGYLAWLAAQGFDSTQFGSFAVNVVDDAPSLTGHPDLPSGRIAFAQNPTGQSASQAGHGFLNAHIVGGFNANTGTTYEDASGYNYGLGIAPWARVGSTAIFGSTAATSTSYENTAYGATARISNNSWGYTTFTGAPIPDYDAYSQEYDFIVRDAQTASAGLQELTVVFAAGNDGSSGNTVSTPGTAKNVITVGASENFRQTGTDGCGIGNTGANDADDLISFSSRGPVNSSGGDGRFKPEICAPGTHIQAGVPQSNYVGGGVCNNFWPTGSTLYGWSSGTSHSAPAVAGAAALLRQRFLNQGLTAPSPALQKAWLTNAATHMNGVGANDTLPSNNQGMGRANMGRALDSVARHVVDQTTVLGATGTTYTISGAVVDSGQPVRVSLAWTDAPGPTTGAPYVNNLNLTVVVNGTTYLGNVFSGANSTTGGVADAKNNLESVFLPAGTSGSITVTVTAATIAGDGVPGNGDGTDQDFALVVYNFSSAPVAPTSNFGASVTTGPAPLTVNFTDTSAGSVTSWAWDFGDGATSTAQNPSHTYAAVGTYTVTLNVAGPAGSDGEVKTGFISVTAPQVYYLSFNGTTTIPGLGTVEDEDVVAYDVGTGTWSMHFDGSDVGVTSNVTGFGILPGGDLVLSFSTASTTVPGLTGGPSGATVTYHQAVRFTPTSLGATTAGSFTFYFDGPDVGISANAEQIDGFTVGGDGAIYLSTTGNPSVTGLTGLNDEDVLRFVPTALGSITAGTWSLYFDGSDVGFADANGEDLDAIGFDSLGRLLFSTTGSFAAPGASGDDEDLGRFAGSFGATTSGTSTLVLDLSVLGIATTANIDAIATNG
jgi:PKD repeat protein